jgi:FG-GAP-like repeat/FG-GAP repeat/Tetratricopeptide repeat
MATQSVLRGLCLVAILFRGSSLILSQDKAAPLEQLQTARKLIARGELAEAEAVLTKVVEEFPKSAAGWFQLGLVRHTQGKLDSALEAHLKAAEFPQVRALALYNAGCAYARQQKTDRAIEQLEKAVAAGFADRIQFASDTELESVRSDKRFARLLPPLLDGKDLFVEPTRVLHTFVGEGANHEAGWVARRVGDLDGDKVEDFVTTAPGFGNGAGKVYVYSSQLGKLLFSRVGQPGQRLGNGAAGAGDVNGDGIPDVIAGGPMNGTGITEVLSGKDGTVIHTHRGTKKGGQFGYMVCGLGDINGDGRPDFAVTALQDDGKQPGSGRCYGYSGQDGKLLFALDGEAAGDKFGSAVAGSLDAKYPMLAVGAQDAGKDQRGRVYIHQFLDGVPNLAFTIEAEESGKDLGQMFLSFPGDLNGDGVPDVYCSDFNDSARAPGAGRVFVYSGKDGKRLLDIKGTQAGEGLGTSPSDAGDVNGDGVGDLVVGAWQNRDQARSAGKAYLYSGADGKVLTTWTCRQQDDTFGFDATGLGDVDGDGNVDFLFTSGWSPARGPKTGRVYILAGPKLPPRP